ncbi:MAG: hypothetical protein ACPG7F_01855 [Aggregatilineales bacterium]
MSELAVEIISDPSNTKEEQRQLRLKLSSYQATGVTTWVVNAEDVCVEIHHPGEKAIEYDIRSVLTVEDILPGFELPIKDIFPNAEIISSDGIESKLGFLTIQ